MSVNEALSCRACRSLDREKMLTSEYYSASLKQPKYTSLNQQNPEYRFIWRSWTRRLSDIHCKIRLGWRTQRWKCRFTWCMLSFVKIQGINLTICHVLLCSTRTSYRGKHFGSQSHVMKICKCWLVIICTHIHNRRQKNTVVEKKQYRFDLIFQWACGFNQNISRFSTTWVRGEV